MPIVRLPTPSVLSSLVCAVLAILPARNAEQPDPARGQGDQRGAGEPRTRKEEALARLREVVVAIEEGAPEVDDRDDAIDDLEDAIDDLEDSLDPDLWLRDEEGNIDPQRLDPDDGSEVFEEERECAEEIFEAIDDGDIENVDLRDELLAIVDVLVAADRRLAEVAIGDAQAALGDEQDIEEALDELEDGDELVAEAEGEDDLDGKGRLLFEAIEDEYGEAWEEAIDAVDD